MSNNFGRKSYGPTDTRPPFSIFIIFSWKKRRHNRATFMSANVVNQDISAAAICPRQLWRLEQRSFLIHNEFKEFVRKFEGCVTVHL
jgi:hypothetical protein